MSDAVLITGAGTGIGLATALHLAGRDFRVYASVPDLGQQRGVEEAAEEHGVKLRVLQLDVTDQSSIETAVETVVAESGDIFAVVNSAGLGLRGFFEDLSEEEIRQLFDVNVFGVMAVTRTVLPYMRVSDSGRIVIVTSAGGRVASMTLSGYCASKFALEGFGESLALEVAPFGIEVSLIEPGLVMTPHFTVNRGRAAAATDPDSPYYPWFVQHEKIVDDILRTGRNTPADVAEAIYEALAARRPKLRYVVGRRAKLLILLRRLVPFVLFDRVYKWQIVRMVTEPRESAGELSQLSLGDVNPSQYLALDESEAQVIGND